MMTGKGLADMYAVLAQAFSYSIKQKASVPTIGGRQDNSEQQLFELQAETEKENEEVQAAAAFWGSLNALSGGIG